MKKTIILLCACLIAASAFGQAKKPRLMIVPSDNWCYHNGYLTEYDNQGVTERIPDYQTALIQNTDLLNVISKLNGIMEDRGFPCVNLETAMKSINRQSAELNAVTTKSGDGIKTNDLMLLRQQAKADIILQLTWQVNQSGPRRSITYRLQGLDSYTDKEIASAGGTGTPSFSVEVPVLLEEAVNAHMDEFLDRLQSHFDDMFENGRAISIKVNVFENDADINLETEFNKKELREIIEDWIYENTVSHRYNLVDDSEIYMNFQDVRIPLYDERGRAIAANNFARNLVRHLRNEPYNIDQIKLMNQGLGQVTLVVGGK